MGDGNNFQYFYLKEIEKIILKNKGKGKRQIFEKDGCAHRQGLFSWPPQAKWIQICGLRNVN